MTENDTKKEQITNYICEALSLLSHCIPYIEDYGMNSTRSGQRPGATAAGSVDAMSPDLLEKHHMLGPHLCLPASACPREEEKGRTFASVPKEGGLPMASASGSALKMSSLKT